MSEPLTPLIQEPLTVDVVNGQVVMDGGLPVQALLTPEAAIETGVLLIQAGVEIEPGMHRK